MAAAQSDWPGPHEIYLAEYNRLRDEIDNRTRIGHGIVAGQLAAIGAALASFASWPDVAIGLPVVSAILWMLWSDQEVQIWKLAAYIHLELARRLREVCPGALGWEEFLRRVDGGGEDARAALRLDEEEGPPPAATRRVGFYAALMHSVTPLVLLVLWLPNAEILSGGLSASRRATQAFMLLGAVVAWGYAARAFRCGRRYSKSIDLAIIGTSIGTQGSGPRDGDQDRENAQIPVENPSPVRESHRVVQ